MFKPFAAAVCSEAAGTFTGLSCCPVDCDLDVNNCCIVDAVCGQGTGEDCVAALWGRNTIILDEDTGKCIWDEAVPTAVCQKVVLDKKY